MKAKYASWYLRLFWVSGLAEILGILMEWETVHLVAKPLLMVTLLLYFLAASTGYPSWRYLVYGALGFSWAGDVFLMAEDLFVLGLASFLVAHIFYIAAYQKTGAAKGRLRPVDAVKFVVVGLGLVWVLYPGLGDMLIPVIVYALVLLTMAIWAHKRRDATSDHSFALVAAGAVLFVMSDAAIAVNKFALEVPFEAVIVMTTYISAQYLIVRGLVAHTVIPR